ncbi:hypothetical protein niasHT_038479 [Heterodera trifolii]|uniref:Uncharacterized protein n=1 Tax=Heterodera trifolii TaxID=157864 RepID=A0ABD2J650_9BILA
MAWRLSIPCGSRPGGEGTVARRVQRRLRRRMGSDRESRRIWVVAPQPNPTDPIPSDPSPQGDDRHPQNPTGCCWWWTMGGGGEPSRFIRYHHQNAYNRS